MKSLGDSLLLHVPAPLHRIMLRCAQRILRLWRRAFYSPAEGCAVIVQNDEGHVLLVRHTYCEPHTWMLPSGRMKQDEAPVEAARREMQEEVKCELSESSLLEFEDTHFWGRRYTTFIVSGQSHVLPEPDLREISEAAFFSISNLPPSTSMPTRVRLERWRERQSMPIHVPAFVRLEYVQQRMNRSIQA